jgi:hypothetical protein
MTKEQFYNGILWIWALAATVAYAYQFRGFLHPIINLLGLS